MGSLTDLKIRTATASGKEVLIADGDGLYLRIRSSSRAWVYRYKQNGICGR
ncbi:Arm DNA-binding domain-containing protein [Pseudorhodoferax sp. LjRoot39]|uniref:Arm DNA-binding domain-containing protein n=1 Tax=Pseudorhodoferax sp. LjRoot39 TaxID=3342328 RepID=UPI003ECFBEB0